MEPPKQNDKEVNEAFEELDDTIVEVFSNE
jgi:hypothetical protein